LQISPNTPKSCSQHKSLPEISSPQDLTENKHTHTHIQREREKKTTITIKFLPQSSSPQELTGTGKHTPKEKNNSKSLSFAPANQINQNLEPTRSYRNKHTHTHTHKEKNNNKRLSFAPTEPNQPNFLRQISSPKDLTRKNTHHPKKKNKNKSLSFPPTQPNQIKPKTRSSPTEEKIDSKQLLYKLCY
jgi:hypothetical protein